MFIPNTKYLVVDDFATMRKVVKKVLTELGYSDISEAEDGKIALQLIQEAKAGVSEYVVKPFNAATLKEKLTRVYNKHNPAAKAA